MSRKLILFSAVAALFGNSAVADTPNVAVDIAPIHSLVSSVMNGVGVPNLIIPPGSSPHEHQLRPSQAKSMQDSNILFWMGKDLTPWMENAVKTLSGKASVTTLLENDATTLLKFREGALFHIHKNNDDHDHIDHGNVSHDPHAWLSPNNAKVWLNLIATQLSIIDSANAGTYFSNAALTQSQIAVMVDEINAELTPYRGSKFVVYHDAYQYFENDFNFYASGAISMSDASVPSPARIAKIQKRIRSEKIDCVLTEPQFKVNIIKTVMEGSEAKTNVIDPLGIKLKPGPAFYNTLIRNMAQSFTDCF